MRARVRDAKNILLPSDEPTRSRCLQQRQKEGPYLVPVRVDDPEVKAHVERNGILEEKASKEIKAAFGQSELPGFQKPYIAAETGPGNIQWQGASRVEAAYTAH